GSPITPTKYPKTEFGYFDRGSKVRAILPRRWAWFILAMPEYPVRVFPVTQPAFHRECRLPGSQRPSRILRFGRPTACLFRRWLCPPTIMLRTRPPSLRPSRYRQPIPLWVGPFLSRTRGVLTHPLDSRVRSHPLLPQTLPRLPLMPSLFCH